MNPRYLRSVLTGIAALAYASAAQAANMGTAFTYQGQLKKGGVPKSATCNMTFQLWDAATLGNHWDPIPVGPFAVPVVNGLFTRQLDFGANAFNGDARWLEISVQCPGDPLTTLSPRQELKPAPHALALPGLYTQQNATSPNLIGGFNGNTVTANVVGATISGGGLATEVNRVTDDYGTVGGGRNNQAGDNAETTANRSYATVGGGVSNTASGPWSTVGGGSTNKATWIGSTIGGGADNRVSDEYATVGGGVRNTASNFKSTVGGGEENIASGENSTVGGGAVNTASGFNAIVAGGNANHAGSFCLGGLSDGLACYSDLDCPPDGVCTIANFATVGGGASNRARGDSSTVGGGSGNSSLGQGCTVGGGVINMARNVKCTVGGGGDNTASGEYSTVGGGGDNTASGTNATVGGGLGNNAGKVCVGGVKYGSPCQLDADCAAPGTCPTASPDNATVGGGLANNASGTNATVGGGQYNTASGLGATVGGGGTDPDTIYFEGNTAAGRFSTISGGSDNSITGLANYATIGGGYGNRAGPGAVVAGGGSNTASGGVATVPGGQNNVALGDFSFAAGQRAKANHNGTFVWADSIDANFVSTGPNQFLVRAAGGMRLATGDGTVPRFQSVHYNFTDSPVSLAINPLGGNVGIGTNAPGRKLQVGDPGISDSEGMIQLSSRSGTGASNRTWDFGVPETDEDLSGAGYSFVIDDTLLGSTPEFLVHWGTGNVGIGTTTPSGKLHISSSGNDQIILSHPTTPGFPQILFQTTAGVNDSGISYDQANDLLYLANGLAARLTITNSGNVGIGLTPATNKLEVNGDASKAIAGGWLANSDAAIKEQVRTVSDALSVIDQLRPVAFRYTDEYRAKHPSVKEQDYYNYIAQEFRDVFPDSVQDSGEDGLLQMDSYPAGVYAVAAIQELHQIVQERDCEIDELREHKDEVSRRNRELEERLSALETLVNKLAAQHNGGEQ